VPTAPRFRQARRVAPLVLAATLAGVTAARALDLALSAPRERNGYVWVDARIDHPFTPRIEDSIVRGMPATLIFHAELWRNRTGWFDHFEGAFDASIRLIHDVAGDRFLILRRGQPVITAPSLDSLTSALERPVALPVTRVGTLDPRHRYYAIVTLTLKPLSPADVAEVENWFSGEVADKRQSGLSGVALLPGAVFDAMRNLAGFGDERARAQTDGFDLVSVFGK
jgi:hypothetical protein